MLQGFSLEASRACQVEFSWNTDLTGNVRFSIMIFCE